MEGAKRHFASRNYNENKTREDALADLLIHREKVIAGWLNEDNHVGLKNYGIKKKKIPNPPKICYYLLLGIIIYFF